MPRYLVVRELGDIPGDAVVAASERATLVRERDFPGVGWEHSHVVRVAGGLRAYCVYSAPGPDVVRAHAAAAGLPADEVLEIEVDLRPDP